MWPSEITNKGKRKGVETEEKCGNEKKEKQENRKERVGAYMRVLIKSERDTFSFSQKIVKFEAAGW